jgi:hypothetical protein
MWEVVLRLSSTGVGSTAPAALVTDVNSNPQRVIPVTERNIWFLERSIPLFGILSFFPGDSVGPPVGGGNPANGSRTRKLTIDTDQGWSFTTDIVSDAKIFRNSSRNRGSGKWVLEAGLQPGDRIVIEKLEEYRYLLKKETS